MMRRPAAVASAFQAFFRTEAAAGVLLMGCAALALVAANSRWAPLYQALLAMPIAIGGAGLTLSLTLQRWINDGLMAIFFLMVGLEIKREVLAGELSSPRQAALPIAAALGGMIAPIAVYVLVAGDGPAAQGWAIAMATDIAFALGALALVAPGAAGGLKIFLAALAIVDDIGAVLVIAVFYTGTIVWHGVEMAGSCLLVLIGLNLLRVRSLAPYLLTGVVLWFYVHESGIHATIAGVLLAFTIPVRTRLNARQYSTEARRWLNEFERTETGDLLVLTSRGQQDAIFAIGRATYEALAPLLRLEHTLHAFSAFAIMPLFAFSNAGINLGGLSVDRVALAVILGLVIGKPVGITAAAVVAVRSRVAALPPGVTWMSLHGCGWLGGIGFTMALFIATLAFEDSRMLNSAKLGILTASAVAGIIGAVVLRAGVRSADERTGTGPALVTEA